MQFRCRLAVLALVAAALFAAGPASATSFGGGSHDHVKLEKVKLKHFTSGLDKILRTEYPSTTWNFDSKTFKSKNFDFDGFVQVVKSNFQYEWDGQTWNDCRPKPPPPPPGVPEPSAALLFAVGTVVATRRRFLR